MECNLQIDEFPAVSETVKAIQLLSSGKALGSDAIPAEIYKAGSTPAAKKMTELFHIMWRKEAIPQEFKDASFIHLFKQKGNPQLRDNHRGISLLSISGKVLQEFYLTDWMNILNSQGFYQCGFRKDRGTTDIIFTARQLQEKCQEQNTDLYMTFVDLTKAFNTVSRERLWKIMAKFGCPTKSIAMVRQCHDGMLARAQNDGEFSDPFPVTNGVKQGCVQAPALFSMMFPAMLTDAFQDGGNGIPIRWEAFQPKKVASQIQGADRVARWVSLCWWHGKGCSNRGEDAKTCRSCFWLLWQLWPHNQHQKDRGGLSTSSWPYKEPSITAKGQWLQVVHKFTYPRSTFSRVVHIDDAVNTRIAKASAAFGRLRDSVWGRWNSGLPGWSWLAVKVL